MQRNKNSSNERHILLQYIMYIITYSCMCMCYCTFYMTNIIWFVKYIFQWSILRKLDNQMPTLILELNRLKNRRRSRIEIILSLQIWNHSPFYANDTSLEVCLAKLAHRPGASRRVVANPQDGEERENSRCPASSGLDRRDVIRTEATTRQSQLTEGAHRG